MWKAQCQCFVWKWNCVVSSWHSHMCQATTKVFCYKSKTNCMWLEITQFNELLLIQILQLFFHLCPEIPAALQHEHYSYCRIMRHHTKAAATKVDQIQPNIFILCLTEKKVVVTCLSYNFQTIDFLSYVCMIRLERIRFGIIVLWFENTGFVINPFSVRPFTIFGVAVVFWYDFLKKTPLSDQGMF